MMQEEPDREILLGKKEEVRLSWKETYQEMAREQEDWGGFDITLQDGLEGEEQERDTMDAIAYRPIGVVHSPFRDIKGMPIQPTGARGIAGTVEVAPEYADGLRDLAGFSHVILLYHFHLSKGYALEVQPFLDDRTHGVFAVRAPRRPNPIGLSVVALKQVDGCTLHIEDVDVVDGTPLLDIKPYVPAFDAREDVRTGWLADNAERVDRTRADGRFGEGAG